MSITLVSERWNVYCFFLFPQHLGLDHLAGLNLDHIKALFFLFMFDPISPCNHLHYLLLRVFSTSGNIRSCNPLSYMDQAFLLLSNQFSLRSK